MPGYEYNPLTKLDLQKKSAVSPSDIQHLEQEIASINEDITDINGDLKNKVPKFFTSIEELEIGEIGEYQGDTNETFTRGFFYERGSGTTEMVIFQSITVSPTYYADLKLLDNPSQQVRFVTNLERTNALYHGGCSVYYTMPNGDSVEIFGFPADNPYIMTTRLMPAVKPISTTPWYAMPKAYNYTQKKWVDFDIEIIGTGNWDWSVTIEGQHPQSLAGWGFEAYVHQMYYPYPEIGYVPCLVICRSNGAYVHPMPIELPFIMQLDGLWFERYNPLLFDPLVLYLYFNDSFTYNTFKYVNSPSSQRVDTQPATDPSQFATADQGAKADTALQSISVGTDGDYITTTIGTKDANNNQTVGVSAKIQDIATADNDNKGFAESSNVKAYAATAAQGAKADTALQSISHGTDGNYVTSTIGAKDANNEQSVSVSLTLQPISTAGSGAKGLAEASDVKDYIGNNTATPQQGRKADSALQGVVHGTDGLYIATSVSSKDANNEQTIYTSLTLQDIETADASHKGVAEASNVRNMFNIIAAQSEAYGVMWDTANPSPQCIRIGNMYNHLTLPVQSQMIGGVMADDGTFTPFDNQTDWTQATQARDGSDGQVMIKTPQHWRKLAQYGTIRELLISPIELPGYVEIPTRYCGAYEASIERSTGKLCSVNNATADYRGGDNTSAWDGTYRTLLNRPVTNLNQSEFLAAARLRAAGTSWNNLLYKICRDIYWLFVTEYATIDSQAEYNAALDANGFRQGGLGAGVTTWEGTSWANFNSYNPFVPCGYLDEYGNQTAVKDFSLFNADSTLLKTFSVNSYRGIRLPFGHTWKHIADVLINVESGDGNSAVYLCDNPANYNSSSVANYNFICNQMRIDSYVKKMVLGDNADIFAIEGGGNSTSYYCDQQWCGSLPSSGSSLRCWLFGGVANYGSRAGLACAASFYVPGDRYRGVGSRLCFVP